MDKLRDMESLRSYILESKFIPDGMARAIFNALPLVEATNINKDFLIKTAGSPEALATAKQSVNTVWAADEMDGVVRNQNVRQKVLNILYLMEIRKPGFVNHDILKGIHDLAIHNSLEQRFLSKVNSDSTPENVGELLVSANQAAVQSAKAYPDLTAEEETIWNRVKVYHEFPDGFRWVYAVDSNGRVAGYMPSRITAKTMHHCGNQPSAAEGNQYWELRDANGKAYLTVILNGEGKIEESKSWGNQVNRYRKQILPYVKWFLMDRKVTGVGRRYDYGYSTHTNFGVKDFIGDDNEFVEYVLENKPALLGNTEKQTLFWKNALEDGLIDLDTIKSLYADECTLGEFAQRVPGFEAYNEKAKFKLESRSLFGENPFEVLCAACGGCPFSEDEMKALITNQVLGLEECANYDVHMLTPEIQRTFIATPSKHSWKSNFDTLMEISREVASFQMDDDAVYGLVEAAEKYIANNELDDAFEKLDQLFKYIAEANPPSKVASLAKRVFTDERVTKIMYGMDGYHTAAPDMAFGPLLKSAVRAGSRIEDVPVEGLLTYAAGKLMHEHGDVTAEFAEFNDARLAELLAAVGDDDISAMLSYMYQSFDFNVGRIATNWFIKTYDMLRRGGKADLFNVFLKKNIRRLPGLAALDCATTGRHRDKCVEYALTGLQGLLNSAADDVVAIAAVTCPEVIDLLTQKDPHWVADKGITNMLHRILGRLRSAVGVTEAGLTDFITRLANAAMKPEAASNSWWLGTDNDFWDNPSVEYDAWAICDKYGIQTADITAGFTTALINALEHLPADEYSSTIYRIGGIGNMIMIPMDRWQDMGSKYSMAFVKTYIINGVTSGELPAETSWETLLDCMPNWPELLNDAIIKTMCNSWSTSNIRLFIKLMSDRIVDGRYKPTRDQISMLRAEKLINAKLIRHMMDNDESATKINGLDDIHALVSSFHKMTSMPALPSMIKESFKYYADVLYQNLGATDGDWNVDVSYAVSQSGQLAATLATKCDTWVTRYYVAKGILDVIADPDIFGRLKGFGKANMDACKKGETPRFYCFQGRRVDQIVKMFENLRMQAESTVARKAPKPKAPRARKPKAAPPVA